MKKIKKSIIIISIALLLANVIIPTYSQASVGEWIGGKTEEWIGKFLGPLADFVCSLGDTLQNFMQGVMMPGSPKAVTKRSQWDLLTSLFQREHSAERKIFKLDISTK